MPTAIERVLFVSQDRAEAMRPPRSCAVISITDPEREPARLPDGWSAVFRVSFHDIDPVSYREDSDDLQAISVDQAEAIALFCRMNSASCRRFVVHCRYGVSRSAAVAKALCEVAGVAFPEDYEDHNDYVYRLVVGALKRAYRRTT